MKKYLLGALTLALAAGSVSADEQHLRLKGKDGSEIKSVPFSRLERVTFADQDLVIHKKGGEQVKVPFASLLKMVFSTDAEDLAVDPVMVEALRLAISPQSVSVLGLPAEGLYALEIYALSGKMVYQSATYRAETPIFTGHLPAGMYLIRINHHTLKFIKQ